MLHTNSKYLSKDKLSFRALGCDPGELVQYLNTTPKERRYLARRNRDSMFELRQDSGSFYSVPPLESYVRAEELHWEKFRHLVICWLASDRDMVLMRKEIPEIDAAIRLSFARGHGLYLSGRHPEQYSWYVLRQMPREEHDPERAAGREATLDFVALITSGEAPRLSRCVRCQKFYVAGRKRSKMLYCREGCGPKTTAAQSMQKRRDLERAAKIKYVRDVLDAAPTPDVAVEKFKTLRHPLITTISKNFLTRILKERVFSGEQRQLLSKWRDHWERSETARDRQCAN